MQDDIDHKPSTARRALISIVRYVWIPTLVLLVIDLSVDEENSILRGGGQSPNRTIVHDLVLSDSSDDHAYFGLEDEASSPQRWESYAESTSLGSWSARFDAAAAGEVDPKCWSPVVFDVSLLQMDEQVSGSGSYLVDPAECSVLADETEYFLTLFGERRGGRISLRVRDSDTGDLLMTFDGLIMPQRLSGWFYGPDARPASGPVTMQPARG